MDKKAPTSRRGCLGWIVEFESTASRATIWRSNQLSYTHHINHIKRTLARQKGLEPPAYCLEGSCSIQLSYWRMSRKTAGAFQMS